MTVTLNIPDFVAASMQFTDAGKERRVLEAVALEGYRSGELSRGQVGSMLGLNYWATEAFLKQHGADYGLTAADLEQDYQALKSLLARS